MPKGPKGEKRPANVIGAAILVGRIATGDAEDKPSKAPKPHCAPQPEAPAWTCRPYKVGVYY